MIQWGNLSQGVWKKSKEIGDAFSSDAEDSVKLVKRKGVGDE
jgi:hypothetical protein